MKESMPNKERKNRLNKRLILKKDTVRTLSEAELKTVVGGGSSVTYQECSKYCQG